MFTAKIIEKVDEGATIAVTVEFTDGVDTYTEVVRPQDLNGFKYFVRQRCESLTTAKELKEADNVGKVVDTTTQEQTVDARTLWIQRDNTYSQVLYAVERGYLTGNESKVVKLKTWLKNNFKPEYIGIE